MKILNHVIIISGAGSGLGRALAIQLSKEGGIIIAAGRRLNKVEETISLCSNSANHMAVKCDVTVDEDQNILINAVLNRYQRIDMLVNNAAVVISGNLKDFQVSDIKKVVSTDLLAVILLTKKTLPHIEKSDAGRIINIGSMASYWPMPFHSLYNGVKFGIAGFTKSLSEQYYYSELKVMLVYPGQMKSEMISDKVEAASRKMGWSSSDPMINAAKILNGIKRDKATVYAQTSAERIMGHLFTKHILFKCMMRRKMLKTMKTTSFDSNLHTKKALYRS
jgi:3-oxoacyl-[acyl-carrier protein] reductase